jgi:hypothetical protein
MAMDQQNEPAEIKYTKRMLELVEREINETKMYIANLDSKMHDARERKKFLYGQQIMMLKELRKAESGFCEQVPNVPLRVFADGEELKL